MTVSESAADFMKRMEGYVAQSIWQDSPDFVRLFALARRGAATQWRPIEEAPNEFEDGRDVLLLTMDGPLVAHWGKGWWLDKGGGLVNFITHFMPLPPPPKGETE